MGEVSGELEGRPSGSKPLRAMNNFITPYKKKNNKPQQNLFRHVFGGVPGKNPRGTTEFRENPASSHPSSPLTVYETQSFVNSIVWEKRVLHSAIYARDTLATPSPTCNDRRIGIAIEIMTDP